MVRVGDYNITLFGLLKPDFVVMDDEIKRKFAFKIHIINLGISISL